MSELIQFSVMFRNDKPNGFGFGLSNVGVPQSGKIDLQGLVDEQLGTYRKAHSMMSKEEDDESIKHYLFQCESFGHLRSRVTEIGQQEAMMIGIVLYLTERGAIPNEEFNGTQFVYSE